VTADLINGTIIKDGWLTPAALCKGIQSACTAAGISG
jgi:hypothetical protein